MTNPRDPARTRVPISTRAELEHRRADRPKLAPGLHLPPPGFDVIDVKRRLHENNEARIKQLQTRLRNARTKLRHDVSYAKLKGRARGDFDRSR